MKIISWNIYTKNRNIKKAIAFLAKQNADIICLQEFPAEHLQLLESLNMHTVTCQEILAYKSKRKPTNFMYSVILSRPPISQHNIVAHKELKAPKRSWYDYFKADTLYADIDAPEGKFRIFNTHFKCVTGPYRRLAEFMEVLSKLNHSRNNIICGDFNSFGKPWVNLFLWKLFGYKIQEITVNEHKHLTEIMKIHGLENPLKRQVTFYKFPIQLDYILTPSHLPIKNKRAFSRLYGSDHFPLLLEI